MIDKHPSDMTEDERAALVASDPSAFDEPAEGGDEASAKGADADEKAAKPDEPEVARAEADEADDDERGPDRRAFNGVLNELRDTRRELQELRERFAQQQAKDAPAPRDYEAERKAMREKYDAGDLDDDEYEAQREALLLEQAEARAMARLRAEQQAEATKAAQVSANEQARDWNDRIAAWVEANEAFCSNAVRMNALQGLIQTLGADASLSNEALLARVEKEAFDAFGWKGAPATGGRHAARNAADAAAASRGSAVPPALSGGVGVGSRGSGEGNIDLSNLKPGTFSKMSRADQERLLGEGALD